LKRNKEESPYKPDTKKSKGFERDFVACPSILPDFICHNLTRYALFLQSSA